MRRKGQDKERRGAAGGTFAAMGLLTRLHVLLCHRGCYVVADGSDNSITLSRSLVGDIRRHIEERTAHVLVFTVARGDRTAYAFAINPVSLSDKERAALPVVQHNSVLRCTGFASLCPTVNRLLYDYHLTASATALLHVVVRHGGDGTRYYEIEHP